MPSKSPWHFITVPWWYVDAACLWWIFSGGTYLAVLLLSPEVSFTMAVFSPITVAALVAANTFRINYWEQP